MYTGSVHKLQKIQRKKKKQALSRKRTSIQLSVIEVEETKLAAFNHSNSVCRKENFRAGTDFWQPVNSLEFFIVQTYIISPSVQIEWTEDICTRTHNTHKMKEDRKEHEFIN